MRKESEEKDILQERGQQLPSINFIIKWNIPTLRTVNNRSKRCRFLVPGLIENPPFPLTPIVGFFFRGPPSPLSEY